MIVFLRYILVWQRFLFSFFPFFPILNISSHYLLAGKVSAQKSSNGLMGVLLYMMNLFSLVYFF